MVHEQRLTLRVYAILMHGAVRIFVRKCNYLARDAVAVRRRLVLHFGEHGSLDLPAAAGDRTTARVAALDDGFLRANRSAHLPTQEAGIAGAPAPAYDDDALIDFFVQGHMGALLGADGVDDLPLLDGDGADADASLRDAVAAMLGRADAGGGEDRRDTPLREEHLLGLGLHLSDVVGTPANAGTHPPGEEGRQSPQGGQGDGPPAPSQTPPPPPGDAQDAFDGAGMDALGDAAEAGEAEEPEDASMAAAAAEDAAPGSSLAGLGDDESQREAEDDAAERQRAAEARLGWTGGVAMGAASVARLHRQLTDAGATTLDTDALAAQDRNVRSTLRTARRPRRRRGLVPPLVDLSVPPIRGMAGDMWSPHSDFAALPEQGGAAEGEEGRTGDPAEQPATIPTGADGPDGLTRADADDDAFDGAGMEVGDVEPPTTGAGEAVGEPPAPLPPTAVDEDIEALRASAATPGRRRSRRDSSAAPRTRESETASTSPRSVGPLLSRHGTPRSRPSSATDADRRHTVGGFGVDVGGIAAGDIALSNDAQAAERPRRAGATHATDESLAALRTLPPQALRFINALDVYRAGGDDGRGESLDAEFPELVGAARRSRRRKFAAWAFMQSLELASRQVLTLAQDAPYAVLRVSEGPLFVEAATRAAQAAGQPTRATTSGGAAP